MRSGSRALRTRGTYLKEVRALRGYFGPPMRQKKMKFAFHQILLISLLEQWPTCISLMLF